MSSTSSEFSTSFLTILRPTIESREKTLGDCKNFADHMSNFFIKDMYVTLTFFWNDPECQEMTQKVMSLGIHQSNKLQEILNFQLNSWEFQKELGKCIDEMAFLFETIYPNCKLSKEEFLTFALNEADLAPFLGPSENRKTQATQEVSFSFS